MAMIFPPANACPGTLHYVPPSLAVFEPAKPLVRSTNVNTLLWVGGMFDTFMSVSYPFVLSHALGPTWSLMTASLTSAGLSWGVGSIADDARDLAKIVTYIRNLRPGGNIVLMGHSTGCQDCMEYVVGNNAEQRPPVEGVILQAPVSDREAIALTLPTATKDHIDQVALGMCREGNGEEVVPNKLTKKMFGKLAITAKRWVDVSSPGPDHPGADDYFSSDLPIDRLKGTFGKVPARTPLLILHGGADEAVPSSVDKVNLIQGWADITEASGGKVDQMNSGVVPQASHNLNGQPDDVVEDLVRRVLGFVKRLDEGDFTTLKAEI